MSDQDRPVEIKIPDGWRKLGPDDIIQPDDLKAGCNFWRTTAPMIRGKKALNWGIIIRKIK